MRLGIFGGTFNPPHEGHLHIARAFLSSMHLDKVIWIPTNVPPHKAAEDLASGEERLEMCRLICKEDPAFEVSDLEMQREGRSYTADTLEFLHAMYPEDTLCLLMGEDMFLTLLNWYKPDTILALAEICAVPRSQGNEEKLTACAESIRKRGGAVFVEFLEYLPVSSTMVREKLEKGESVRGLIPAQLEAFIRKKKLYGTKEEGFPMTLEEGKALIKPLLTEKRYYHSVNVAKEAVKLAKQYGADPVKAEIAGILHDSMKDIPAEKQLKWMEQFGIILSGVEISGRKLWHAILGAEFARREANIEDPEILDAIRYHTTGRADMSILEKVIFIADFISEDRDYPGVDRMRKKAYTDLDSAILEGTAFTIQELVEGGWAVHPDTVALYNETVLKKQKR